MFDVAFSEILLVAVVALVVIGPERLPKVARTLGLLVGRMQRYVHQVKRDIEHELHAQELARFQAGLQHDLTQASGSILQPPPAPSPQPANGPDDRLTPL